MIQVSGIWHCVITFWLLVSDVSNNQSLSIFKGQVILDSLELPDHEEVALGPSKCRELVTQQHSFTIKKTWMFNKYHTN